MARDGQQRDDKRGRGRDREERDNEFIDKLVHINRVAKVVKGGRRFGFAALVVVGDQNGRVGFGHGKAREVPEAIRKATEDAKRSLVRIPLKDGRTLHHEVRGHHGAGKVLLRPAPAGTGIIAGGPMRAVFEALGVGDVVSKSLGTSNPYNMVRATFDALKNQQIAPHGRQSPRPQRCRILASAKARRRRSLGLIDRETDHGREENQSRREKAARPLRFARSAAPTASPKSRRRPCAGWASARSAAPARWKIRRRCAA